MLIFDDINRPEILELLLNDKIGVLRTDTLYGVVGRVTSEQVVDRIYHLKERTPTKPLLLLISNKEQLVDPYDIRGFMTTLWPGKHTIILPAPSAPPWLTRDSGTLAYRWPDYPALTKLLSQAGPLVAPSANPEGKPPALTIDQAIDYFGDSVDFYVDSGEVIDDTPSQLLQPQADGTMERLR